eukprot:g4343.t1
MGKSAASKKNAKRRAKKKLAKEAEATSSEPSAAGASKAAATATAAAPAAGSSSFSSSSSSATTDLTAGLVVEYVSAEAPDDPEFAAVFKRFAAAEDLSAASEDKDGAADESAGAGGDGAGGNGGGRSGIEDNDDDDDEEEEKGPALSRRQRRKRDRLTVAELKQLVKHPEVVEAHDVTTANPRLLVYLKSYKNSVPVPRHWCHKRKYLQGKRGIEKLPFQLPDFIVNTGITKLRSAVQELDDGKRLKQKQREKTAGKMGKIDIDYQVLHDAFFKHQSKPKLTGHGDLYYESREFETQMKNRQPGNISEELKEALGMPEGAPPPWLINMQRYGPPPAYPKLKIPGVNAPIPPGASFGYHPGGWGQPPVDENGQPVYGDVFGTQAASQAAEASGPVAHWGELQDDDEDDSEEEEESEEDEDADDDEINPDEIDKLQDPSYLEQRREEMLESQQGGKEDLSDVIAEEQRKRKRKQGGGAKKKKKETGFKF